jgi:hypothetical protein
LSNNAIICQHTLFNTRHSELLSLTINHHLNYCSKHNFDYSYECSTINQKTGDWDKIDTIINALKKYKYVVWLDVDAMIVDTSVDLREAMFKPINVCEYPDPNKHYHVGVMYFENSPILDNFMYDWKHCQDNKIFWAEQGVFNYFARGKYKWIVKKLGNEWNSSKYYNPSDHPIVKAWHGWTEFEPRIKSMRKALKKCELRS